MPPHMAPTGQEQGGHSGDPGSVCPVPFRSGPSAPKMALQGPATCCHHTGRHTLPHVVTSLRAGGRSPCGVCVWGGWPCVGGGFPCFLKLRSVPHSPCPLRPSWKKTRRSCHYPSARQRVPVTTSSSTQPLPTSRGLLSLAHLHASLAPGQGLAHSRSAGRPHCHVGKAGMEGRNREQGGEVGAGARPCTYCWQ